MSNDLALVWVIDGAAHDCPILLAVCPKCLEQALVELPPPVLAQQPDDTTHVCHPALGGCNHGFAMDKPKRGPRRSAI